MSDAEPSGRTDRGPGDTGRAGAPSSGFDQIRLARFTLPPTEAKI
jgi:hypothetical protein